jgi:hypothetical protein
LSATSTLVDPESEKFAGELLGGLVRPAGEDQLIELLRLFGNRRDDPRVAMAMRGHPPRRNRVDHAAAIGDVEDGPLGVRDERDGLGQAVLGERMPDRRAGHCGRLLPSTSSTFLTTSSS